MQARWPALAALRTEKQIVDLTTRTRYDTISQLGRGSGGNTFTASTDGSEQPSVVIKEVRRRNGEAMEVYKDRVRREYLISLLMFDADPDICERGVVCAESQFFHKLSGYIVFPFDNAVSLERYLEGSFYDAFEPRQPLQYQIAALLMAERMCDAVDMLHSIGLYHGDIKPANVVVTRNRLRPDLVTGIKLIDFDLACSSKAAGFLESVLEDPRLLACAQSEGGATAVYYGTPLFLDPLAGRGKARTAVPKRQVDRFFPLFDLFALGLTIQLVFDVRQDLSPPASGPFIVRDTRRMPKVARKGLPDTSPVLTILRSMTGDAEDRQPAGSYQRQFKIVRRTLERQAGRAM